MAHLEGTLIMAYDSKPPHGGDTSICRKNSQVREVWGKFVDERWNSYSESHGINGTDICDYQHLVDLYGTRRQIYLFLREMVI